MFKNTKIDLTILLVLKAILLCLPTSGDSCIAQTLRDHPMQIPSIDKTTRRHVRPPPPPPKIHLPIKLRLKPNRTINEIIPTDRCGLAAIGPSLDPYELNRASSKSKLNQQKKKLVNHHNRHHRSIAARIVNGEKASVNSWPWIVRIYIRQHDEYNFRCVGSLVDKWFVLTSAYCVHGVPIKQMYVSAGSSEITGGRYYAVETVKIPGDYSASTRQNDLAILKLKNYVILSATASTICLPANRDVAVVYNKNLVVAGW